MSNRTCAKLRNARQLVRENMDSEVFFESYMLSEKTTTRLDFIRKRMKNNIAQADPMWKVIVGEVRSCKLVIYVAVVELKAAHFTKNVNFIQGI